MEQPDVPEESDRKEKVDVFEKTDEIDFDNIDYEKLSCESKTSHLHKKSDKELYYVIFDAKDGQVILNLNANHTIKLSNAEGVEDKLYFLGLLLKDKDIKVAGEHNKLAQLTN